ncbi:hypothetical protein AM493_13660 [Flavobacterium akiainvivens]|uniref:DoxX family protein n=1 Tax=Flavobacterium akiainvivens TaxID=1202724 RepID=A0A0M8MIK5_9FLAO|nr:hypothetical protein [Flavobacterium akiainvivens]KOS06961.1 hypothetical protein AM493_13660 [Flavobacterium akiainvivens]SFQ59974.1 hypothetical protein SAMN05444144_109148 [Flavobacterium akiainvivens]
MKQFLSRARGLFFVLCMVFIPFAYRPVQQGITELIFEAPVRFLRNLLYSNAYGPVEFSSDTRSMLLLMGILVLIAAVLAIPLKKHHQKLLPVLKTASVYYLAFVLLKYGLDKVYLRQFYTPAPNILYTPFGNLDRDILYWSTIGIAPAYQIIMGITEVLAALLLLINRTRFIGLLLTIITLVQVVIINFTFDISVKMFSLLLLAMAVYASWPQLRTLFAFLLTQKPTVLPKPETITIPVYVKAGLKCFAIGLMLLHGYTSRLYMRNPYALTGAYEVMEYTKDGKVQDHSQMQMKRIFIHPKNYIIMEMRDSIKDFYFIQDHKKQLLHLKGYMGETYNIHYRKQDNTMVFDFLDGRKVVTTPLPWQQLPALQPQFHFTIDGTE